MEHKIEILLTGYDPKSHISTWDIMSIRISDYPYMYVDGVLKPIQQSGIRQQFQLHKEHEGFEGIVSNYPEELRDKFHVSVLPNMLSWCGEDNYKRLVEVAKQWNNGR